MSILESDVEQEMLGWFEDLGYEVSSGQTFRQMGHSPSGRATSMSAGRAAQDALHRLNPELPAAAIGDAVGVFRRWRAWTAGCQSRVSAAG